MAAPAYTSTIPPNAAPNPLLPPPNTPNTHTSQGPGDGALLYGELSADALGSLATTLSALYAPFLADKKAGEWGRVDARARAQFVDDVAGVARALEESAGALSDSGLELARPPEALHLDEAVRAAQPKYKGRRAALDADTVDQLQSERAAGPGTALAAVVGTRALTRRSRAPRHHFAPPIRLRPPPPVCPRARCRATRDVVQPGGRVCARRRGRGAGPR